MRSIEQRARLEQFEDRLQVPVGIGKALGGRRHIAGYLAREQRREHAVAGANLARERGRNRIGQLLDSPYRADDDHPNLHLFFLMRLTSDIVAGSAIYTGSRDVITTHARDFPQKIKTP